MKTHLLLTLVLVAAAAVRSSAIDAATFPVSIRVDAAKTHGELKPIYRFFGADEPNYATMKDGRKLLGGIGQLGDAPKYFRAHSLLVTGDGTPAYKWGSTNAYTEDAAGRPVYDWTIVDHIFDTYLAHGVRPYAEIGFMPEALSTHPEPYQHEWRPGFPYDKIFTGWAYPPKDYAKWEELVYQWTKHCVDRYGAAEVAKWYWEVWNEANTGYWRGSEADFEKLHDYAIAGVRRALPDARVGGPDFAGDGGKKMDAFLEHVLRGRNYATGQIGTPLDFISFHAKGSPTFVDGHVRMGIAAQLRTIDTAFARFARYPELKGKPIIIGESDPDGCAACQGPQLGYRNTTMYASYEAAVFARTHLLAEQHGVNLEGAITWAFEFEDQPYFPGFRVMASNGIPLPVFNVFRMMAKMTGDRVDAVSSGDAGLEPMIQSGVREKPDVAAIASVDAARHRLAVLIWHYHDDDVPGPAAAVTLAMAGLPVSVRQAHLTHYRVDDDHSNAYTLWRKLGSPIAPGLGIYHQLEAASELATLTDSPGNVAVNGGVANLEFTLPRQAVSLVVVTW
ncbi:MAG TPA: beta-xylosidase [Opitutaceae bacterium]|nr:beta-xylosidase [Opitutaceae bacterium]